MKIFLIASLLITFIGGLVFESFRKKNKFKGRIILIFGTLTNLILISNIIYKDYLKSKTIIEGVYQVYLDNSPLTTKGNNMYYIFNKNGIVLMGFDSSISNLKKTLKNGINEGTILTGNYSSIWINSNTKKIKVNLDSSKKTVIYSYDSINNELLNNKMVLKFKEGLSQSKSTSILEKTKTDFCSLTIVQTFDYLINNSPFKLGNKGEVNFTKRFDFNNNKWVEGEVNISGGIGSNSRLSGNYEVTNRNTLKVYGLKATDGMFDASRNSDTYGTLTINCNGDIEGYLKDYKGNSKDILIKKN